MTTSAEPWLPPGVVVIGGSAGAIPALTSIMATMPARLSRPLLIVLHWGPAPTGRGGLIQRLQRVGPLGVAEAEDLCGYHPDTALLAPPGYHLLMGRATPVVSSEPRQSHSLPSIDASLTSAADTFGANAMGVVLSCANLDGLAGCRAILAAGGQVLAQAPGDAAHPMLVSAVAELPGVRSAPSSGLGDLILQLLQ